MRDRHVCEYSKRYLRVCVSVCVCVSSVHVPTRTQRILSRHRVQCAISILHGGVGRVALS